MVVSGTGQKFSVGNRAQEQEESKYIRYPHLNITNNKQEKIIPTSQILNYL